MGLLGNLTMPGSVAHMLIFEDMLSFIDNSKDCNDLVTMLKENINYGRLGSLGPDLPYYDGVLKTAYSFLVSGSHNPAPLEKWSGQLHSKAPNLFPLKMIEITWRETDLDAEEWDEIAKKQWAFIIGFLTHMAADQMIHPYVNKIAGQYYRSKENREKHLDCEVYQDVVVFDTTRNKSILDENFDTWVHTSAGPGTTEPYFRIFLQKSFMEAHGMYPSEKEIEDWVRGLLFVYTWAKWIGLPYTSADKDFQTNRENSEKYKEYWLNKPLPQRTSYMDYYNNAVELASIYVKAANKLYEINHADFKDEYRQQFLAIVSKADLTNPLDTTILEDAKKAYREFYGEKG
jgi:hypothetical protein